MLPSIIVVVALSLSSSLAAVPPRRDETHHIPIRRRSNVRRGDVDYAAAANALRHKYGFKPSSHSRRAQTTDIGLTNQGEDSLYFAQFSIGTPAQSFDLLLDTGSSDLWFAANNCSSCPQSTPMFNPTKSSTFATGTERISISYGSGDASGILSHDTISFGPFTVNPQVLVSVDTVSTGLLTGEVSGIMGLAFQGLAFSQAVPFWQAVTNNNLLTNPEFSFFITRFLNDPNAKNEEPGGVLTIGGTNSTLYQGEIDFQPFTPGSFWLQTVSGVTVGGKSVNIGNSNSAAIDTGTTLIGGPTEGVDAIWGAVSGAVKLTGNDLGFYSFPCDTPLNIAISFGGPAWPVSNTDMNLGTITGSPGQCRGAIFDITAGADAQSPNNPVWIVGDTFLKNVYSVFRSSPPAVGFAQLSSIAGGSSGTPSTSIGASEATGGTTGSSTSAALSTVPPGVTGITVTCVLSLLTSAYMLSA